jgi:hypothetical protein
MAEAYPLYWPYGWKRTTYREDSRFKTGFGAARIALSAEIDRMGGSSVIISTNVPLRNDGMPRASSPEPKDAGVAVYFKYKKRDMVFACDKYRYTRDNIYAIAKTIEALRGIERWGASDMMERAFTGFVGLPEKASQPWREILDLPQDATVAEIETSFRTLAKVNHPDNGGNRDRFEAIVAARKQALAELAG